MKWKVTYRIKTVIGQWNYQDKYYKTKKEALAGMEANLLEYKNSKLEVFDFTKYDEKHNIEIVQTIPRRYL